MSYKTLILLYIFVYSVCANNEVFITVDSKNSGLCFGVDDYTMPYCQNQTFNMSGTADHTLYILPDTGGFNAHTSNKDKILYVLETPISLITVGFGIIIFIVMALCVLYVAAWIMYKGSNPIN